MSDRSVRIGTLALIAAIGVLCVARLELTNTILHFIPSRAEAELVALSLELVESPLAQRMTLSIEGGAESRALAEALAASLENHPEVTWVGTGIDPAALRDLYALYFARRIYFTSTRPDREIPAMLTSSSLEMRALELRRRLRQPDSLLVTRVAPADPLGLFERLLARVDVFAGGRPRAGARPGATIQLGLRSSPFDSERQADLLSFIETEFARLGGAQNPALRLEQSGVNRYALATEQEVRGDINLISSLSLAAVSLLFLSVFRSLRQLLIAFLVPAGGFICALALTTFGGEPIHGITLGFGFVLIGVAIDYPIHLMNHHTASGSASEGERTRSAHLTRDRLRNSLLASGLTTTLAFSSLVWSDFPGLSDMGRFAAIGVPVSLAIALFALPSFLPDSPVATPAQLALVRGFERWVRWLRRRRRVALSLCLLVAILGATGIPRLSWEDDPATLMAVDPALHAESERVRRRVADFDGGRFVVALAPDEEAALALNSAIDERLRGVIERGELEAVGSLNSFLWPEALQRANLAAFRASPDLAGRLDRAFARQGFRSGAFEAFAAEVAEPKAAPLRIGDLAESPLARVLDSLVEIEGRWAALTYLRGVRSASAITGALEGLDGVHYVDQKEILSKIYEGYRRSAIRTVAVGSCVVLGVLLLRYRNPARALLAFVPALLACTGTLGALGHAGIPVNVVSAVSLLVVLGMGVDYGIFAVDAKGRDEDAQARDAGGGVTLSSLFVSCITSVFVFGVLALSTQPALRAIGTVTGLGVLLALFLAPGVMALTKSASR